MRMPGSLACLLVAAGCGYDPVEVRVWTYEHGTIYRVYDPDSSFLEDDTPAIGQCGSISDIRSPDDNYDLPETCVRGARIERDGVVVASTQNIFTEGPTGSFLEGNFSNAELILEGCEQDVRVLLPTSFPPTPAISAAFDEGGAMRVNWTVLEPTELVRVSVGSLVGKWCVVPPTDTTISLFGYNVASVTAITTMPIVHADIGNVRAYGGSYVEMMVPH